VSVLFSCSRETGELEAIAQNDDFLVSQDSAVEIANQAVSALSVSLNSTTEKTRGVLERRVKQVDVVCSPETFSRTRSNLNSEINTALYIVNYENSKGFAVVSSDKRLKPIYALADTGNLNVRDTIINKGLSYFFQGVYSEMLSVSTQSATPVVADVDNKKFIVDAQVYPLLLGGTRKWGQDAPYNKFCFTKDGKVAAVGCPAVAMGQILSYYNWPLAVDSVYLLWRSMKRNANDSHVAKLLSFLGRKDVLDMDYGVDASGAEPNKFPSAFEKMGYLKPDPLQSFSESKICKILDNAQEQGCSNTAGYGPILVYGENVLSGVSHIWVIDGYAKNIEDGSNTLKGVYYHCVWGQNNGLNNGYFYLTKKIIGGQANLFDNGDTALPDVWNKYTNLAYMACFRKNKDFNGYVE